jgi:hypothetical protein
VTTRFHLPSRVTGATLATAFALLFSARDVSAQRTDSARVAPRPVVDTAARLALKPPLSPRRAFAYSLLIPGLGQSRLNRPTAGAIFVFTESIALAMLRESTAELRQARRFRADSLVFLGYDPLTGAPINQSTSYNDQLVEIRKGHVEDWIAFLVGNHLFAAADAYVAAHLWDLPSQIEVRPGTTSGRAGVTARIRW